MSEPGNFRRTIAASIWTASPLRGVPLGNRPRCVADQNRLCSGRDGPASAKQVALHQRSLDRFQQLAAAWRSMTAKPAQVTRQTHDLDRIRSARDMPSIPQLTAKLHSQIGNQTLGDLRIGRRKHRLLPHRVHHSSRITAALVELRE